MVPSVNHMLECEDRDGVAGAEYTRPVVIEDDCWIGGGAIICPGGWGAGGVGGTMGASSMNPRSSCLLS